MTSGERYDVSDPYLVAIGASLIFYCYPRSDRLAWLRLNQISHIETLQKAA